MTIRDLRRAVVGVLVGIAIVRCTPGVSGQQADTSAIQTAERFLSASANEDWRLAASLVHPETAAELKCRLVRQFREAEEPLRLRTADEMMAMDSSYTREVAQHYADQINATLVSMRRMNSMRERYPGIETVEQFDSIPAVDVVASQLAALTKYSREVGVVVDLRARIVGAVEEPPSWLNVLFRLEYEYEDADPTGEIGFYRPQPRMLRLRRSPDGWRVANWWGLMNSGGFMGPGVLAASASRCTASR